MIQKFKLNFANGLYLPMFVTSILVAFNFENGKGVSIPLTIISVGIVGSWLIASIFSLAQHLFDKKHGFGWNEVKEAGATGTGAFIGAPISYGLYLWWGSNVWQIVPGCILAAIIIYKWRS